MPEIHSTYNRDGVTIEKVFGRVRVAKPDNINVSQFSLDKINQENKITDPDKRFKDLQKMASYLQEDDMQLLVKAYKLAKEAHQGQTRKAGEPFVLHPIEVAIIVADLHMDIDTLCAALLHDTVEDTDVTSAQLAKIFNYDVALLVEGVTKITRIEVDSISESQALTLRKMFVAMSSDLRVIVIKLADRLHNMRTLYALREDRRIFKSTETIEIFAPIAHRLGIDSIKWELEDLCFYYLEPNKYKQIARMVVETRDERKVYLESVIKIMEEELAKNHINCRLMGRPKHLYSIYCKMRNKGKGFSEIYDLIAIRILVEDVKDCYAALGVVHSLWKPIPGRFKDYIAMPKNNMYQSLHTSVIGPAARPLEVQIRTEEMHKTSEYGVAAHWRYKEKSTTADEALNKQLAWLREMVNWQDETPDSKEMLKSLKVDLNQSEVYVFTPNGEVKSLRAGSTPVDFAYAVHTQVGHRCVGAKVNGSIVPLTYRLKTGDRVEIMTQNVANPSRDWLNFVKTPSARSKIRSFYAKKTRTDDMQAGHDLLVLEMRKHKLSMSSTQSVKALNKLCDELGYKTQDDLLIQLGTGKESVKHIVNRLLKILADSASSVKNPLEGPNSSSIGKIPKMVTNAVLNQKNFHKNNTGVIVKGIDDIMVRLSKCCNPVPGDKIIGFITRGRGVSVHRENCPNAKNLLNSPERMIDVAWDIDQSSNQPYQIEVGVEAVDRIGLLKDIADKLSTLGTNFVSLNANTDKYGRSQMRFLIQVSDLGLIDKVLDVFSNIEGVINVYRVNT